MSVEAAFLVTVGKWRVRAGCDKSIAGENLAEIIKGEDTVQIHINQIPLYLGILIHKFCVDREEIFLNQKLLGIECVPGRNVAVQIQVTQGINFLLVEQDSIIGIHLAVLVDIGTCQLLICQGEGIQVQMPGNHGGVVSGDHAVSIDVAQDRCFIGGNGKCRHTGTQHSGAGYGCEQSGSIFVFFHKNRSFPLRGGIFSIYKGNNSEGRNVARERNFFQIRQFS